MIFVNLCLSDFFKKRPAVNLGFGIIDKDPATLAGDFFSAVFSVDRVTVCQGHAATDAFADGKKPSLDGSDDIFKHNSCSSPKFRESR